MAIKKYYVNTPKPGYAFDKKTRKYFSWGIDIWLNGRRTQERGFASKSDAETAVVRLKQREKLAHLGISAVRVPYLIELFQRVLDTMQDRHDRVRAKRVFSYLLKQLPQRFKVTDLRTAHLQAYVTARTNDGVTAATIRRELVPIVSALRSGYKYFEDLEGYTPPRIPRPKVEKAQKERVISKTEQDGLFAYFFAGRQEGEALRTFEGRYRTGQFLMFCLLTLSRPGEIAALKKDDIDLTAGVVSIHGTKTRFRSTQLTRRLSITPTMRRIIEERLNVARGEFLFTSGGSVTPTMYEQLKAACESIGVRYGRTDKQAISFHTARHTGITMLLQNNVDLKTVGRMAGQSDSRMTLYYTHSNPELVSRASAILEQKMGREIAVHRSDG